MKISFKYYQDYLYARLYELYSFDELKKYVLAIKDKVTEIGVTKILVDLRDLVQISEKQFDRVLIMKYMKKLVSNDIKISLLNTPSDINYMAVMTGVDIGININVFTNESTAIEWLLNN